MKVKELFEDISRRGLLKGAGAAFGIYGAGELGYKAVRYAAIESHAAEADEAAEYFLKKRDSLNRRIEAAEADGKPRSFINRLEQQRDAAHQFYIMSLDSAIAHRRQHLTK